MTGQWGHVAVAMAALAVVWPYYRSKVDVVQVNVGSLAEKLTGNELLGRAEHLFEGEVVGPEAFVVEPSGSLLTGLSDGRIVRISTNSSGALVVSTLVRTGENHPKCGRDIDMEPVCGRPLGIHLDVDPSNLLIVDGYKGLMSLNLENNELSVLATDVDDGTSLVLPNALVPDPSGDVIYITETSQVFPRRRIFWAALSGIPTGRLLAYRRSTKTISVLLENLFMPNGIVFEHDSSCLLFTMTTIGEIKRYCPETGELTRFATGIPATMDNIQPYVHPSGGKGYILGLGSKQSKPFSLLHALASYPSIRRWLCGLPVPYELTYKLVPKYGLLGLMDKNGNLNKILQDPSGRTSWISEAIVLNGSLWMGSWLSPFLARIKLDDSIHHGVKVWEEFSDAFKQ